VAQRTRREVRRDGGNGHAQAVLDTAVDAIVTIDSRGAVQSINSAGERMFGYEAREVVGRNVRMLMPAPEAARHDEYIAQYFRTGRAKIIGVGREVVGRRRDGSTFPVSLAVSEVRVGDRVAFTGILRDLTEQKELEKEILEIAEREQRRIGQDLHDGLCQQLTGIAYLTNTLQRRLTSNDRPEAAEAMQVTGLLTNAIDQARAQSRALNPVEPKANGLEDALRTLAADVSTVYGIRCQFRGRAGTAARESGSKPFGDALTTTHLFRIAQEAVNNAVHHGKAKRVTITLDRTSDGAITLSVDDSGVGFPTGARPRSPNTGHTARRKWWGMGLRTMSHRAHLIGGTLEIGGSRSGGAKIVCRVQGRAAAR
jgi:two-component system, LuxR family, sensor kinase FixL